MNKKMSKTIMNLLDEKIKMYEWEYSIEYRSKSVVIHSKDNTFYSILICLVADICRVYCIGVYIKDNQINLF